MTVIEMPRAEHGCAWGLRSSECHACCVERTEVLDPALREHVSAFEFIGGEYPEMRVMRADGREAIFDIGLIGGSIAFIGANDAAQDLMMRDISAYLARRLGYHMEFIATHEHILLTESDIPATESNTTVQKDPATLTPQGAEYEASR